MGCDLVGIDTSAGMLAVAEEKLKGYEGVAFKQIDVHQLDFPDESFDVVVAMTSFEFMQDQDQALSEMWRVLKEGGQLVIGTINAKGQWAELYLSDAFRDDPIYSQANFVSLDELLNFQTDQVSEHAESLFLSPDTPEANLNLEYEQAMSLHQTGGFIAVSWLKEKWMTCQLSYYALGTVETNEQIEKVLDLIKKSDLDYQIGDLSTYMRGPSTKVFALLQEIHQVSRFKTSIML